ncbi:thermosome subunit beta [Candidatus Hecatella orcuttiae]|jgi:thermosome|uniref:thermosome subunit beta n=1 Tax=Candidatus Hecatella orcuttiae TaxID=1935119 RepID=UPI00286825BD|nr:thermosome subunit beta [Candidatus Hecatella orcuttiae]
MAAQAIPAVTESGQPVLILKEGTTQTKGREAQRNNITAAKVVAEIIRTCLGPRGMDKMLISSFGDATITNDGATILKEMDIQHPAAKMMVETAKATDQEVGDGTTSVVVLAGALLEKAEALIDKNVHPTLIVDGYSKAEEKALEFGRKIAIPVDPKDKGMLKKVAITSMASKLVSENRDYLADLAVEAILQVAQKTDEGYKVDIGDVKVEKKAGASITDTQLIRGVAVDKEVVHSGMPRRVEKAKIALLESPLEIEKTEFDAKINIETPEQMKSFMDEETRIFKEMVDKIAATGANVVFCQKGIDDMAQHFLAKRSILAIRRVKQSDMEKLSKATGGRIVTSVDALTSADLGSAELVEERKLGEDKWTFVEGCKNPKSLTILVRGGTERVTDEAERSIHDALSVVRDVVENPKIVVGGGAFEAEVSTQLRNWAQTLTGREQLAALDFADALESIPLTLAENAGADPLDIQVELRSRHEKGEKWYGVDVFAGKVADLEKQEVLEPLRVKEQIITSAHEAAAMILRIDDVIAASKMKESTPPKGGGAGGEESSEFD